ncbi:hypothetical protein A2U01_0091158, partial [Trifolium medium]|nr:hypothetical protein [Trifolium medium]
LFLTAGWITVVVGPPVMDATNGLLSGSFSPSLSSDSFSLAVMASTLSFRGESLFGERFLLRDALLLGVFLEESYFLFS